MFLGVFLLYALYDFSCCACDSLHMISDFFAVCIPQCQIIRILSIKMVVLAYDVGGCAGFQLLLFLC